VRDTQRFWRIVLNIALGGMVLIAAIIGYEGHHTYFYLVGLLTWIFAVFVFISRPDNDVAYFSYLMSVGLMSVCSVGGQLPEQGWLSKFIPLFQFAATAFLPCIFFRFFAVFPSTKQFAANRFFKWWVYAPATLLFVAMSVSYLSGQSYERLFFLIKMPRLTILNLICLFGYSIAGHGCLLHTWLSGETESKQMQAKWLFIGLSLGTVPVAILDTVPRLAGIHIPYGGYSAYTLVVIVLCYGVAILKYKLVDIEFVLNRSSVYAIVSSAALVIYLASSKILKEILSNRFPNSEKAAMLFSILIVALLFARMKERVQGFIDRNFDQRRYNYHETLLRLSETLSTMLELDKLAETLLKQLDEVLQPEFTALLLKSEYAFQFAWESSGYGIYRQRGDKEKLGVVLKELDLESIVSEPERVGERTLVIPLHLSGKDRSLGFVLLGSKLSGAHYNIEDISLMKTLSNQTAISIENAQTQHEAELMQAARMESLHQLVAGFAHVVNNPAGIILSNSDNSIRAVHNIEKIMGERHSREMEENKELVRSFTALEIMSQGIKDAAGRIADIVDSLRQFVELDKSEQQRININERIDNVIDLMIMNPDFSNEIEITRGYGDIPKIHCYPSDLSRVFMSMFKNACEAIDGEGEVNFRTYVREGYAVIEISDTGIGIPAADMHKIFYPGFSTKGAKVGLGIGLSVCHKIIFDKHNGRIDVSSEPGKGTIFTITLPIEHDETQAAQ